MYIDQRRIRAAAPQMSAKSAYFLKEEAGRNAGQTAFLSHSHKDAELAKSLQAFLQDLGWKVYIDWQDHSMPAKPSRETGEKIQSQIKDLNWFLYLATRNSSSSKWCPWEIGYADGVKRWEKILIIPTRDDAHAEYGQEYLDLYQSIDYKGILEGYRVVVPRAKGMMVSERKISDLNRL